MCIEYISMSHINLADGYKSGKESNIVLSAITSSYFIKNTDYKIIVTFVFYINYIKSYYNSMARFEISFIINK